MHSNLAKDELDTGLAVKETWVNTDGIYGSDISPKVCIRDFQIISLKGTDHQQRFVSKTEDYIQNLRTFTVPFFRKFFSAPILLSLIFLSQAYG